MFRVAALRPLALLLGVGLLVAGVMVAATYAIVRLADVHVVLKSSQPRVAVREAVQAWESGQYGRSLPRFARAGWLALDSSLRWRIAESYVKQADAQFRAGLVEDGFESCYAATNALGDYDGAAAIEAACWETHITLRRHAQ